MNCVVCGNKLKRNEEFCTYCGYYNGEVNDTGWDHTGGRNNQKEETIEEDEEEKYSDLDMVDDDSSDEELIKEYIGSDYYSIKNSFYNFSALIFNWLYFIYKKQYLIGIVGLFITIVVLLFYWNIFIWYFILCAVLIGLTFNTIYMHDVKKKVSFIKEQNQDCDMETLSHICRKAGGTSTFLTLFCFAIFLTIVVINSINPAILPFYNNTKVIRYFDKTSENKATCNSVLSNSYKNIKENVNFGILEDGVCKVVKSSSNSYEAYLKFSHNGENVYVFYLALNTGLLYQGDTEMIEELKTKKSNNTITNDELEIYNKIINYESIYNEIKDRSSIEDEEIRLGTNNSEKFNFIFTSNEITR